MFWGSLDHLADDMDLVVYYLRSSVASASVVQCLGKRQFHE
jgi:hypothetical protein